MELGPQDPTPWISALLAVFLHGIGHTVAAATVGIRFRRIKLTATGFRLITDQTFASYRAEAITALGGPLCNLLTAMISRMITPMTTTIFFPLSLYLGLLNLLPLRGFDGGTVLLCALCARHPPLPSLLPRTAEYVLSALSAVVLFLLWVSAVYLLLRRGSALSLYAFCLQLFRSVFIDQHEHRHADF